MIKELTDKQLRQLVTDLHLITGFLNENFSSFTSYCEQHEPDVDAEQIVSDLEKLTN